MPDHFVQGITFYLVFLISTSLHEAGHAWAALRGGDSTAADGGQVSIDPLPHIRREPFGMVVLPLISVLWIGWPFGYASAPYDPNWAARYPHRAGWMALAGPAANFLIVLFSGALIMAGLRAGVFAPPEMISFADVTEAATGASQVWVPIARFLGTFFAINLLIACFNLLPFPPLDGSAAIMLGMSQQTAGRYQEYLWRSPYLMWIGLFVAWQVFYPIFDECFEYALDLLYIVEGLQYR